MIFSRKLKKFSANNIDPSFQKCPLAKKCKLNDIFHARKWHFAPGKRDFANLGGGGCPPPGPPVPTPLDPRMHCDLFWEKANCQMANNYSRVRNESRFPFVSGFFRRDSDFSAQNAFCVSEREVVSTCY